MECEMCGQEIGSVYAFTAVISRNRDYKPYGIGKAIVGRKGYSVQKGMFETYDEAVAKADELNKKIGLTDKEAFEIVAKTMWN